MSIHFFLDLTRQRMGISLDDFRLSCDMYRLFDVLSCTAGGSQGRVTTAARTDFRDESPSLSLSNCSGPSFIQLPRPAYRFSWGRPPSIRRKSGQVHKPTPSKTPHYVFPCSTVSGTGRFSAWIGTATRP